MNHEDLLRSYLDDPEATLEQYNVREDYPGAWVILRLLDEAAREPRFTVPEVASYMITALEAEVSTFNRVISFLQRLT
jgi:hypothetical protein